jgi:hypothetical protein
VYGGDQTIGKTRNGAGYTCDTAHLSAGQRLRVRSWKKLASDPFTDFGRGLALPN